MEFQRMALAFWEITNDLQTLRLTIDDTLEEITAELLRIDSLPVESRKEFVPERIRLFSLKSNLLATRLNLSAFKCMTHARIEECAAGIFERMAERLTGAFKRSEVRPPESKS